MVRRWVVKGLALPQAMYGRSLYGTATIKEVRVDEAARFHWDDDRWLAWVDSRRAHIQRGRIHLECGRDRGRVVRRTTIRARELLRLHVNGSRFIRSTR
jgi:hypothetical protein